jgi:hypothetical protein
MRIIAYDRFKPGVTMKDVTPYLPEEVSNVWRLWKAGIVRENYARADEPGVVIIFELPSVADAKIYTDDFPLSKALFRDNVDLNEPFDRTRKAPAGGSRA